MKCEAIIAVLVTLHTSCLCQLTCMDVVEDLSNDSLKVITAWAGIVIRAHDTNDLSALSADACRLNCAGYDCAADKAAKKSFTLIVADEDVTCERAGCRPASQFDAEVGRLDAGVVRVAQGEGSGELFEVARGRRSGPSVRTEGGKVTSLKRFDSGRPVGVAWEWSSSSSAMRGAVVTHGKRLVIVYRDTKDGLQVYAGDHKFVQRANLTGWTCLSGVLFPLYEYKSDEKIALIQKFPSSVKHKDRPAYQIARIQNSIRYPAVRAENSKKMSTLRRKLMRPIDGSFSSSEDECAELMNRIAEKGRLPFKEIEHSAIKKPNVEREQAVASYPGSGNTWLRELTEAASGLATSEWSVTHILDPALSNRSHNYNVGAYILMKTHHFDFYKNNPWDKELFRPRELLDWRLKNVLYFDGVGVLLIRNPFDALLSSWNHYAYDVAKRGIDEASVASSQFENFADAEIDKWLDTAVDWLLLANELVVVHYEELLEDTLGQLDRVMRFLGLDFEPERRRCVETSEFVSQRRRAGRRKVVFSDRLKVKIVKAVLTVERLLDEQGRRPLPLYTHLSEHSPQYRAAVQQLKSEETCDYPYFCSL